MLGLGLPALASAGIGSKDLAKTNHRVRPRAHVVLGSRFGLAAVLGVAGIAKLLDVPARLNAARWRAAPPLRMPGRSRTDATPRRARRPPAPPGEQPRGAPGTPDPPGDRRARLDALQP